jgi:hypothetical protein
MLIINMLIILITSVLINLILDIKQYIPGFLCIFLFSFSNVILTCTIAGLVYQLDNPYFYCAVHSLFLLLLLSFV